MKAGRKTKGSRRAWSIFTSHGRFEITAGSLAGALKDVATTAETCGAFGPGGREELEVYGGMMARCVVAPAEERGPLVALVVKNPGKVAAI